MKTANGFEKINALDEKKQNIDVTKLHLPR